MPPASRHAKPKAFAVKIGAPIAAAATLVGVAVAIVFLQSGSPAPRPVRYATRVTTSAPAGVTGNREATSARRDVATLESRIVLQTKRDARRRHEAALAAARLAKQQAAAQKAAAQPTPTPTATATQTPPPSSSGTDAAHSALGDCIRNAEEGGSYAWGPGNGGGAYQFQIGTWEKYGGAASEYGVADAAYQDQIFDNAVAAGGASNWTAYDGC
jgi:hypothetical protein